MMAISARQAVVTELRGFPRVQAASGASGAASPGKHDWRTGLMHGGRWAQPFPLLIAHL
jgi:hypothetical protein